MSEIRYHVCHSCLKNHANQAKCFDLDDKFDLNIFFDKSKRCSFCLLPLTEGSWFATCGGFRDSYGNKRIYRDESVAAHVQQGYAFYISSRIEIET